MISRNKEDGSNVENYKGLDRAVYHFDAGDIRNIKISKINDSVSYIRAKCLASMKKDLYDVYLCVAQNDSTCTPEYAFCQCPIGLAQSCSHVGALLIALNNKERLQGYGGNAASGESSTNRTSTLCQLVVPRNADKQEPQPISSMNMAKPKVEDPGERRTISFDPRKTCDRETDHDRTLLHLKELKQIDPNCGIMHLWDVIPDNAPIHVTECEVTTEIDPMKLKMEELLYTPSNIPPVCIDDDLVQYVEAQTRGQRDCEMWTALHRGRITSSIFGVVLTAGHSSSPSLLKQIIEGSNLEKYGSLPAAIQWGIDKEPQARDEYIMFKTCLEASFEVRATGLSLCNSHAFLGASSDGRITENNEEGVLEIKCPFSIKETPINTMEIDDILSMDEPSFCLQRTDSHSGPSLKKEHAYYAQVQGEMSIMGLPWCDFVVWTNAQKNNIFVERIWFDSDFVTDALPRLVEFYVSHAFPQLR